MNEHRHRGKESPRAAGLSRRRFLGLAGTSISAAALSACAPSLVSPSPTATSVGTTSSSAAPTTPAFAKDPVTLTFFHYAGSNQEIVPQEVVKQYMLENPNVKIETQQGSNAATFPAIVAAYKTTGKPTVQAGYFNPDASTKGDLEDLWLPLDKSRIPNAADIPAAYWRQGNKGVGWGITALGIPYRKDLITPAPTSWLDLLDPKFKGRVGLPDAPLAFTFGGLIVINKIMGGNATTLDKGFKAFSDAAKAGQFHSIFPGNQQLKDLMVKGDIRILGYSYGNVAPWRAEGAPIDYAVPKEGQTAFPLYFQILKGGTPAQVYHSEQLINRLLDPTVLGRYCQLVLTSPTNPKVALPDVLKSDPAFQSGNVANAIQLDWNIVAQQTAAWQEQFNREIKANLK